MPKIQFPDLSTLTPAERRKLKHSLSRSTPFSLRFTEATIVRWRGVAEAAGEKITDWVETRLNAAADRDERRLKERK